MLHSPQSPPMLLSYLHKVAARENLSAEEARQAMLAVLSGEATTPQIAAFLVGFADQGRDRGRAAGVRARHAREGGAHRGAGGLRTVARHLRHGRRWRLDIQHLDHRRVCRSGRGRARGQARQPVHFEPVRQRRYPGGTGRSRFCLSRRNRASHSRNRHRLSVCAAVTSGHEACPARARWS